MKNLYSKNEFLNLQKDGEMINEGFIGKMFKGLYASIVKYSKNVKGSKEIDKVYVNYQKEVDKAFAKFGNIGTVEATITAIKNTNVAPTSGRTVDNINISYNISQKLYEADVDTTPPEETPEQQAKNTGEQKTLANLPPQKLEEISKLTKNRIEELKKELETAINTIVSKLSKNPDYSSDKLSKYATIKKNEFNSYIYNQWYGVYQKTGDQSKLEEIIKSKKAAEAALKQSIDQITSNISETQLEIKSGVTYLYKNSEGKNLQVKVIGRAIGKNQDNRETTDPEHKTMWEVGKTADEVTPVVIKLDEVVPNVRFWVAPSTLKAISPTP